MESSSLLYYPYVKLSEENFKGNIDKVIQYSFDVDCNNADKSIMYVLDFMRYENLWITDVYPQMWIGRDDKCKRFTSHEGYTVDFKLISWTSVYIFIKEFFDENEVMVISGSYDSKEPQCGASRKLKLYKYFFTKMQQKLPFKMIDDFENNAFYILHNQSSIFGIDIKKEYKRFKNRNR